MTVNAIPGARAIWQSRFSGAAPSVPLGVNSLYPWEGVARTHGVSGYVIFIGMVSGNRAGELYGTE
jgi:hypothetical protein